MPMNADDEYDTYINPYLNNVQWMLKLIPLLNFVDTCNGSPHHIVESNIVEELEWAIKLIYLCGIMLVDMTMS